MATYKGKSLKPGGGGRFERLEDSLKAKGHSESSAEKIAAAIGRAKFGAKKMGKFSAEGRKRG